jgi:hypothetical protein
MPGTEKPSPTRRPTRRRWAGPGAALALAVGLLGACGGSTPPTPGPLPQVPVLTLDTAGAYPWQGWGTSLAWWANTVGDASASPGAPTVTAASPAARPASCPGTAGRTEVCDASWPPAARAQVLTDLFGNPQQATASGGQAVDPLGLNVLRYNLGASPWDLSTLPSSCGGGPEAPLANNGVSDRFGYGKAVPAVEQGPGAPIDLNWDAAQLSVLTAATAAIRQASGDPVLQAFANSPPWWMLSDRCPAGGAADSRVDPTQYADYLAAVLQQYQRAGIDFSTVEPFNEPHLGIGSTRKFWTGCGASCQEGASFTLADQQSVVDALCPALSAAGEAGVKVAVNDDNTPALTDAQIGWLRSGGCAQQVDTHGYGGGDPPSRATLRQHVPAGDTLWMSEYGSKSTGDLATEIADDLQELRPSAWVLWQAVDPSWGLFAGIPSDPPPGSAAQVQVNAAFDEFGQFTRYLRPGSRVVPLQLPPGSYDDPGGAPLATVAVDPAGQVVVVATNTGAGRPLLKLDLQPLHPGTLREARQLQLGATTVTDAGNQTTLTSGGQLDVTLPAKTVTTYVFGPGAVQPGPTTTTTEPATTTTVPATTTTTTAPAITTTTTTTPPPTTATPTLTHDQFVAEANQVCRQASAQIPAASDPFDLASIAATLRADQAVLPPFLRQEQALATTQPDGASLEASWLQPMQQDLTAASPLIQQFLSDYDSGQTAAAEQVVEEISVAPDHRDTIVPYLQTYGLTDCAALEEK